MAVRLVRGLGLALSLLVVAPQWVAGTEVATTSAGPFCAITGFWRVDERVVARIWKVADDLGFFQFVGRGQCKDANGRVYASWSAQSGIQASGCKAACEASSACAAFEVTDLGSCYLRYGVDDFPEEPPQSSIDIEDWGDDAAGPISGLGAPYDRYCYRRLEDGANMDDPAEGSGGFWRVMFFPKTKETFDSEVKETKEAPLDVAAARPQDFPDCAESGVVINAVSPFASGMKVWWGLREMNLWAGVPSDRSSPHRWRALSDVMAWDQTAISDAGLCPIAEDVTELSGQLSWTHHALSGVGNCAEEGFRRLVPDTAALSPSGWAQVVAEDFRYGVEVYSRRLLLARRQAVADEACFKRLVMSFWDKRQVLTYDALQAKLDASTCMDLVPA